MNFFNKIIVFLLILILNIGCGSDGNDGDVFVRFRAVLEPTNFIIDNSDIPIDFEYDETSGDVEEEVVKPTITKQEIQVQDAVNNAVIHDSINIPGDHGYLGDKYQGSVNGILIPKI